MAYTHTLTDDEKRELLRIARATLKEFLVSGRIPPGAPHRPSLTAPAAVFVTLRVAEELRGCIGSGGDVTPIYKAIQEMTIASASRDPRFAPIETGDLTTLVIEISVLGARTAVTDPAHIEIGKHGVAVTASGRRGVLLPHVAVEHGWDAVKLLAKTCEKAGLTAEGWRAPDAVIEVFAAQVFDEKQLPPISAVSMLRR